MNNVEERLLKMEEALERLNYEVGKLVGEARMTTILVKYVILPLIIILGGLVGIKIF